MRKQLAHGDALLALLRELGPVGADAFFVIKPSARVGDRQRHRRQAFGGRMHDHHRVAFPWLTRLLVADTAPDVDDLPGALVGATGAAQFAASREVLEECGAHGLVSVGDESTNLGRWKCGHGASATWK